MKLKYQCPICGTQLRYEGLCWKCQSEQNRKEILGWTTEQIKEKHGLVLGKVRDEPPDKPFGAPCFFRLQNPTSNHFITYHDA